MSSSLSEIHASIVSCTRCERLRTYCQRIAQEKKAAHRHDVYWGRPVPGFGDSEARVRRRAALASFATARATT